ncbi:MAG: phosphoserine phosphatase SerB [Pseudomonadales bacterium]|jgi:phosphoserine phosphatase|nr:phosphoserine phosphatase SerB [Pseudomonadales bacterium]MDP7144045.1 phosphoserine phosphatase SerB [Pseudomonadales bacterium]MDP7595548.1 phosphoserine phosphatase SerB [Pseudomonadales bacterium]HJN50915.1 phosphoserine phosphatase SerB [Pseudomonadales bacterium]|tara:strand:- start:2894 stop:4132 length:1239 start_codon:yes stop_codon:yes gene_type:complete
MNELILINISGQDKPGLTSSISRLLGDYDVDVLDIGQAVIHSYLTLGILIRVPPQAESSPLLKDVLFRAHELGVTVRFTPVEGSSYEEWVTHQERSLFILTLLSRKIKADHIAKVAEIIYNNGLNIDSIMRLSGRTPLDHQQDRTRACIEFSLGGEPRDTAGMRMELMNAAIDLDVDIAVQEDSIYRRNRKLIAFDMDSTLIATEVIDQLAGLAGVGDEVTRITAEAMAGRLEFKQSLKKRVALLEGLPVEALHELSASVPLTEGAEDLFRILKKLSYKTAILSGGFTFVGRALQKRLGVDYVFCNELEIVSGKLTGKVVGPIVDGTRKAELLAEIASKEGLSLQQAIAVGDGANDLLMLSSAGLGIAFHAKTVVKESAGHAISTLGLDSILYLMGIRDRHAYGEHTASTDN